MRTPGCPGRKVLIVNSSLISAKLLPEDIRDAARACQVLAEESMKPWQCSCKRQDFSRVTPGVVVVDFELAVYGLSSKLVHIRLHTQNE